MTSIVDHQPANRVFSLQCLGSRYLRLHCILHLQSLTPGNPAPKRNKWIKTAPPRDPEKCKKHSSRSSRGLRVVSRRQSASNESMGSETTKKFRKSWKANGKRQSPSTALQISWTSFYSSGSYHTKTVRKRRFSGPGFTQPGLCRDRVTKLLEHVKTMTSGSKTPDRTLGNR